MLASFVVLCCVLGISPPRDLRHTYLVMNFVIFYDEFPHVMCVWFFPTHEMMRVSVCLCV